MIYETKSQQETYELGIDFGKQARKGEIYGLTGEIGAGKTLFAKGFAKGLEINDMIVSPTFTIIKEYTQGVLPFYHFDVYRIDDISEMDFIGYEDYFYGQGVTLVEWADLIHEIMPVESKWIHFSRNLDISPDYRKLILKP